MPIQIYLGTETGLWLPVEVLKHSIRTKTKAQVEFHDVRIIHIKHRSRVNLGLNFHRYFIPEVLGFKGRAIYLDAHSLCFGDVAELFDLDMKGVGVLAKPMEGGFARDTHVMLFDCEKLKHWKVEEWIKAIDKKPVLLRDYVGVTPNSPFAKDFADLPEEWNVTDRMKPGAKILNYHNPFNVPWRSLDHPEAFVFKQDLNLAMKAHLIPQDVLQYEIAQGKISPDILN